MLNSLSELSKQTFQDDMDTGVASSNVEVLEPVLNDGETIRYVMVSTQGIEHKSESRERYLKAKTSTDGADQTAANTGGRSETVSPDGDRSTYAVVTSHRVLFLVGTGAEEVTVDIEFDLVDITEANSGSGMFSNSLVVEAGDATSVKFVPTEDADPAAVADYVSRISSAWKDIERELAAASEAIENFETVLPAASEDHEHVQEAQSRLSAASQAATRHADGPREQMMARIGRVEDELDTLLVRSRLDHIGSVVGDIHDAVSSGNATDAIDPLVEVDQRLDAAEQELNQSAASAETAWEVYEQVRTDFDRVAKATVRAALKSCDAAASTEYPVAAIDAWESAREWFDTAQEAGWDGPGGVSSEALAFQEAYIEGRRIDAIRRAAVAEEETADDLGETHDEAADHYEAALGYLRDARDAAEAYPHASTEYLDSAVERIEDKRDVSEWDWGKA